MTITNDSKLLKCVFRVNAFRPPMHKKTKSSLLPEAMIYI